MGIFSSIKDAIFGHAAAAVSALTGGDAAAPAADAAAPAAAADGQVDVEAVMNKLSDDQGGDLNWQESIVDMMKLLGIDSSLSHRQELAKELNYDGDMDDSASMNIWLHQKVMEELAANGGKVPANLLK